MKPQWERLIEIIATHQNGKCTFKFQDGLPMKVSEIISEARDIDLNKNDK